MARYADNLLADGERVVLRTRQHWLATVFDGRLAWATFIAALVLALLSSKIALDVGKTVILWLAVILLLGSLLWLLNIYLNWYSEDYLVTNRRVLKVEGILRKRSADSSLEKINDAVLDQSVLGRMLGYGDLEIMTAAELSVDKYRMLAGAAEFKKTMLDEKHALEEEFLRVPAPPLRAAPQMPAGGDGSAAAASAPARSGMSSSEITKALGDLADLRDRGAISAEDYEAKKSDLLGRL